MDVRQGGRDVPQQIAGDRTIGRARHERVVSELPEPHWVVQMANVPSVPEDSEVAEDLRLGAATGRAHFEGRGARPVERWQGLR